MIGGDAALTVAADAPTIWLVDLDDRAARTRAEALALLPGEAAAVADRRDADRRLLRGRLARVLLAAAVGGHPDKVALARDAAGAPVVSWPPDWHLSLAARWPLCAIAIAQQPVGVDIEAVGEPLPPDLLTKGEREWLGASTMAERARAGAWLWATKEAHAKGTGLPRMLAPETIDTLAASLPGTGPRAMLSEERTSDRREQDGSPTLATSPLGTTRCWRRAVGDHVAAVCTA